MLPIDAILITQAHSRRRIYPAEDCIFRMEERAGGGPLRASSGPYFRISNTPACNAHLHSVHSAHQCCLGNPVRFGAPRSILAMSKAGDLPQPMNGTSDDAKAPSATQIPFEDRPGVYGWKTRNDRGYEIRERPSGEPRRMRVIGVGAGASGINLAKALRDDAENIEVAIYDKNPVRILLRTFGGGDLCSRWINRKSVARGGKIAIRKSFQHAGSFSC